MLFESALRGWLIDEAGAGDRELPFDLDGPVVRLIDGDKAGESLPKKLRDLTVWTIVYVWRYRERAEIVMFEETWLFMSRLTRDGLLEEAWWRLLRDFAWRRIEWPRAGQEDNEDVEWLAGHLELATAAEQLMGIELSISRARSLSREQWRDGLFELDEVREQLRLLRQDFAWLPAGDAMEDFSAKVTSAESEVWRGRVRWYAAAAEEFGFTATTTFDLVLEITGPVGLLEISGDLIRNEGRRNLIWVLALLSDLVVRFVPEAEVWNAEERLEWALRTIATGWTTSSALTGVIGSLRVHRFQLSGNEVVVSANGERVREVELVTFERRSGRHELVGMHPAAGEPIAPERLVEIVRTVRRHVVHLVTPSGSGSGIVLEQGRVRTALHVVDGVKPGNVRANGIALDGWATVTREQYGDDPRVARAVHGGLRRWGDGGRTVDLADAVVPGLGVAPARKRRTELRLGQTVLVAGVVGGALVVWVGPVIDLEGGYVGVPALVGRGVSGGGLFDLDVNHVGTLVAVSNEGGRGVLYAVGPELSDAFDQRIDQRRKQRATGGVGRRPRLGEWFDGDTELLSRVLPELGEYLTRLADTGYRMPRGLPGPRPVWVLDEEQAAPELERLVAEGRWPRTSGTGRCGHWPGSGAGPQPTGCHTGEDGGS
ncbi:hypothetical protein GCM10023321_50280 [Pseudonocardia eucalypti]|uniref:Uncharacterized protein n=1 Tax=Pseudonocardia eucalypti TaxID=648755 RepID=A0ABP9QKD0_9PSEU